jgi:hypothetical protein
VKQQDGEDYSLLERAEIDGCLTPPGSKGSENPEPYIRPAEVDHCALASVGPWIETTIVVEVISFGPAARAEQCQGTIRSFPP